MRIGFFIIAILIGIQGVTLADSNVINGVNNTCDFLGGFGPNSKINSLIEVDEHFIVGGNFSSYRSHPIQNIAKINKVSCELDILFSGPSGFDGTVNSLEKTDSHLFVGGDFSLYKKEPVGKIAKIDLVTGNLDPEFSSKSGFNSSVYSMAILGESIYVGGDFSTYGAGICLRLAKLNNKTGSLDQLFSRSSGFDSRVTRIEVKNHRLLVSGKFKSYREVDADGTISLDLLDGSWLGSLTIP